MPLRPSDPWITALAILAFVRAALLLLAVLGGLTPMGGLLDVVVGLILGIGAYNRQLGLNIAKLLYAATYGYRQP